MNVNRLRVGNDQDNSPTFVKATSGKPRRRHWLAFIGMALLAGIAGGLIWMTGPELGALEILPDDPTAEEETAQAATSTPTPALSTVITPLQGIPAGQLPGPPVNAPDPARLRDVDIRTVVAPPTATPTRTPIPPVDALEAVVGRGGATLWEASSGLQVTHVAQGELVTATARSSDGMWIYATTAQGETGWTEAERLIAFDSSRLRVEEVVIMPITPTPIAADSAAAPVAAPADATAPIPADAPTARVIVDDARLNIRSGPGGQYAILAKADPGDLLAVRGRNAAGDWLQVTLPDDSGSGWVASEFVEVSIAIDTLPVVEIDSPADARDDLGAAQGDKPHMRDGMARQIALHPTPAPALPKSATGLQGKLAIQTSWGADIYLYDLATGTLSYLTHGFDPAISPDGTQVAFTRAGGEHGLYLINVDGSNERLIFSGRELLRSPKWSPDGGYIVFERGDEVITCWEVGTRCLPPPPFVEEDELGTERQEKLARVDVNGGNYRDLAVLQRARVPDWNEAGVVYQSPAGIQVTHDSPAAETELVFFNITKQYELDPDWQPDGGRIVFQRREADHWEILSVNPDGSDLTFLTKPGFGLVRRMPSNVAPAWSPDGRHIVFLSNRLPNHEAGEEWAIWVMNADGSNQRRLPIELDFTYTFVAEQMLDWGR